MKCKSQIGTEDVTETFFANEAEAESKHDEEFYQVKKALPKDAEIKVSSLPRKAQELFLGPQGSRVQEWKNMVDATNPDGSPAVRIHRGKQAADLRNRYAHRLILSRWHEKWKDMGDQYDNGLQLDEIAKHLGAKSRWILCGFHDLDVAILNRSVPTL